MRPSDLAAGLLVTRLWKAYLLSSGLLSPLSELIRAELCLCSRSSLLHRPHRPDGGPPPAESLKEHSLWSSVLYKYSRGIPQCLQKRSNWRNSFRTWFAGLWSAEAMTVIWPFFLRETWKEQILKSTYGLSCKWMHWNHPIAGQFALYLYWHDR